jgi:hypothetical protein
VERVDTPLDPVVGTTWFLRRRMYDLSCITCRSKTWYIMQEVRPCVAPYQDVREVVIWDGLGSDHLIGP